MKITSKKIFMPLLILLFAFAVVAGVLFMDRTAYADEAYFRMTSGAQVRYNLDDGENGLKFMAETNEVKAGETYHMVIFPHWYLNGYDGSSDLYTYLSTAASDKGEELVELQCSTFTLPEEEGKYYIQGSITSIKNVNTYENFMALAYRQTFNAETQQYEKEYATGIDVVTGQNILDTSIDALNSGSIYETFDPSAENIEELFNGLMSFLDTTITTGISYKVGGDATPLDLSNYSLEVSEDPIVMMPDGEASVSVKVVNNALETEDQYSSALANYVIAGGEFAGVNYDATTGKVTVDSNVVTSDIHGALEFLCFGINSIAGEMLDLPSVQLDVITDLSQANVFGEDYVTSGNGFKPVSNNFVISEYLTTYQNQEVNGVHVRNVNSETKFDGVLIRYSHHGSAMIIDKALFELAKAEGYTTFNIRVAAADATVSSPESAFCFYSHKSQGVTEADGEAGALLNDGRDAKIALMKTGAKSYSYIGNDGFNKTGDDYRKEIWTKDYTYSHVRLSYETKNLEKHANEDGIWFDVKVNISAILQRSDMTDIGFFFGSADDGGKTKRGLVISGGNFTNDFIGDDMFKSYTLDYSITNDTFSGYGNATTVASQVQASPWKTSLQVSSNTGYANYGGYTNTIFVDPSYVIDSDGETALFVQNGGVTGVNAGAGGANIPLGKIDINNSFVWDAYEHGYKYISIDVKAGTTFVPSHTAPEAPFIYVLSGKHGWESTTASAVPSGAAAGYTGRIPNNNGGMNGTAAKPSTPSFVTKKIYGGELNTETYTTIYLDVEHLIANMTDANGNYYNRFCIIVDTRGDGKVAQASGGYTAYFRNTGYVKELPTA